METESFIPNKKFNITEGLCVFAVLQKHYSAIILCFLLNCVNMNAGGVNYGT